MRQKLNLKIALLITAAMMILPGLVSAQGSIFGLMSNSDLSIPAPGEISFFGYLDNTDEEIRIESSIGAGYDAGNWFDNFQNYLTESPGNPYEHHFYNFANGEGFVLSKPIPNNSYQQEDISLSPVGWPQAPVGLRSRVTSFSRVKLYWLSVAGASYHVYRRPASSAGSFYRIDDPSGSMANPGLTDTSFIDTTVDSSGIYDYLIIAEDGSRNLGPHSEVFTVSVAGDCFLQGDSNGDGGVNVADVVYVINYVFRGGPPPELYFSGDANCDDVVSVGDAVFLINYTFKGGPAPGCA